MPEIVLSSLNAKYIHPSLGLRYLLANLGPLRERAVLREFDINQRPVDAAESLLALEPRVLGLGVYIWNVAQTTELVSIIKRVRPETCVILGGPEVSYETEGQPIVALADYVITGEADLVLAELCRRILNDDPHHEKILPAAFPDFSQLALPYDFYTDEDLAHRIVYVEASRGCPFECEFCLSSLDIPVRKALLPDVLAGLQRLLDRGVKHFKFVDRTFNVDLAFGRAILDFLLERYQAGMFFHFEVIPDRLPEQLREAVLRFPPGALQFELGIQTFNPDVAARISRRQNYQRLEENLRFLRERTGVHLHTDLIFGLPGESLESFAAGFDRLISFNPQEIQVGILKRLRGAPISRHDREWKMIYNDRAPYEILQNAVLPFAEIQRLRRFARYWDLVGNSGNFSETRNLLWSRPPQPHRKEPEPASPFDRFMRFSLWLHAKLGRTDAIALPRLMVSVFEYLTTELGLDPALVAPVMQRDYERSGRRDAPPFLGKYLPAPARATPSSRLRLPKRQARHLPPQGP